VLRWHLLVKQGGKEKEKENYTQRKGFHEKKSNIERINIDLSLFWQVTIKAQEGRGREETQRKTVPTSKTENNINCKYVR